MRQKELCVECCDVLSNPICFDCLLKQLIFWFNDKDVDVEIKKFIFGSLKKRFSNDGELIFTMRCIICGEHNVALCGYCFTRYVYLYLKNLDVDEQILEDFLGIFTYWKWHEDFREHEIVI